MGSQTVEFVGALPRPRFARTLPRYRCQRSTPGLALSFAVALSQPGHYMEIVLPGMLVGALVGFVTQRYPSVPGPRGSGAAVGLLAIAWVLIPSHLPASEQQPQPADPLKAVAWLIGEWSGTSEGQPGRGTVERQYERALGGRFIRAKNRVVFPATEKAPKGDVHEDQGWFSFDRSRKRVVLRQFHGEGFVNQYQPDTERVRPISCAGRTSSKRYSSWPNPANLSRSTRARS